MLKRRMQLAWGAGVKRGDKGDSEMSRRRWLSRTMRKWRREITGDGKDASESSFHMKRLCDLWIKVREVLQ